MNEQEKTIAAKLLTQIQEVAQDKQSDELGKYHLFMQSVANRIDSESRDHLARK